MNKPQKHPPRDERWRAVEALLAPLGPKPAVARRLREEFGIKLGFRAVYNWRARGVPENLAPAVARLCGVSVEHVLKISGKI